MALVFALLQAVILSFVYWQTTSRIKDAALLLFDEKADLVLQMVGDLSLNALITDDLGDIQDALERYSDKLDVITIVVTDSNNRVIGSNNYSIVGMAFKKIGIDPGSYWLHNDLTGGSRKYGSISVEFSRESLDTKIATINEVSAVLAFFSIFVVAVVSVFVASLLTRRLENLSSAANQISRGNFTPAVGLKGDDEISQVGDALELMGANIAERIFEIEQKEARYRNLFDSAEIAIRDEDFSEVCRAMDKLRDQGVKDLRQYLNNNTDVVMEMAALIKVNAVNKATLNLFAARTEIEFVESIDQVFGPNAREIFTNELCAIWNGDKSFRSEATHVTLDGRELNVILSMPIPQKKEDFRNIPVSLLDLTDLKQVQHQLRRSQRMEAIGQLTGGIAHDFNNLLAVIQSNADILNVKTFENDPARLRIDAIIKAVSRGASLTHRLLAFSRQQRLSSGTTDIRELVDSFDDMLQRTLGETIDLKMHHSPDLWNALIDAHEFENALLNLSINARDAMPDGGELTIESANITLDEAYASRHDEVTAGDYVLIAVADTGTGISAEVLEKVFEPFFTTKGVGEGSGLGLSMVYGFVRQSNGHVTISSEPGRGTTINLYLPRSRECVVPDAPEDQPEPVTRGTERILVVEDDPDLRGIAVKVLTNQGYEVFQAPDGSKAVELLGGPILFDLLFTDVVLPGPYNGVQISEEAKRLQPDISVLFTSGYADSAITLEEQYSSNVNLVNKPYRRSELLNTMREMLDSKAANFLDKPVTTLRPSIQNIDLRTQR
jgi:signal transduction histidine kinase/FixJ family two-component response regulator/HAMP domain-containing protein